MKKDDLNNKILYLFNRYWDEDLTEKEEDALEENATELVSTFGWSAVYKAAVLYLHNNCQKPDDVINFAHLYWIYGWYNNPIPNPHDFLGYFYYRINLNSEKYDNMDILDSLATTILPKAGFMEADLTLNTQYMPENDPKILTAIEKYKL